MKKMLCFLLIILVLSLPISVIAQDPIPNQNPDIEADVYLGTPASPQPIDSPLIPQHPFMAENASSNMHNDAYMSDTYIGAGPLGQNLQVSSISLGGDCPTLGFDSQGRIIAACLNIGFASMFLVDSQTMVPLASLELPTGDVNSGTDFTSGSYFYLAHNDHIFIPTIEGTIWELAVIEDAFEQLEIYDLTSVLIDEDKIGSVLPDFSGNLWFVTRQGVVGLIRAEDQGIVSLKLENEMITNSFAVDETGGVFIVSDHALYRFDLDGENNPMVTWREEYDRGSAQKLGQAGQGSGTTPTLMGSEYVAITDNAEPRMNVLVYKRGISVEGERLICTEAVFGEMESSNENSLIATDRSIVVENNYGYRALARAVEATPDKPGMSRIDLNADGTCQTVWTSIELIPSVVSKLSLANGIIYTYTKDETQTPAGVWYFTAIDFETGETLYKQQTGNGLLYNNHYAGLYLGADGTAYVGTLGGIIAIRDGSE